MRFISRRPLQLGRSAMALALILAVGATAADSFREGDKTKAANQDDAKDEPKPAGDSGFNNGLQVVLHSLCRKSAQPVISAEFQYYQVRRKAFQGRYNTGRTAFGGFSAYTGVNHPMFVPFAFQS